MNRKQNYQMKQDAEQRYSYIRKQSLQQTEKVLRPQIPKLRLTEIDPIALQAFEKWQNHPNRIVNWDWVKGHRHQANQYPKRFEMATWSGEDLEALTMGRPSQAGNVLRLDYIEASPYERELKVLQISLIAMELYAELIGADELRIMYPINDAVRAYYESFGYTYHRKGSLYFLWKKL